MRNRILQSVLALAFLCLSFTLSAQDNDMSTASGYMGAISEQYSQINQDMMSYVSATAHSRRAKKIEKKRKEVVGTMSQAIRKIKRMPEFKEDGTYRDAVLDYLNVRFSVMNDDYASLVDMEEVAEQSYDAMELYILTKEKINEKLEAANLKLKEAQRQFASDNNINLVSTEDKFSEKVKKSNQVAKYSNQVYLILFRSKIEERYLREAVGDGDLSAIEQRKNSLQKYSEEGMEKLRELGPFDGDSQLIGSVGGLLRFYMLEVKTDVPRLQNFYLIKEQFEQIKAAIDAKRSADRTQEDIDAYNKAVNDYNNAINAYNETRSKASDKRGKLIDAYNKAQNKFSDKHTPRYR